MERIEVPTESTNSFKFEYFFERIPLARCERKMLLLQTIKTFTLFIKYFDSCRNYIC